MRFPRTMLLLEQGELAADILWHNGGNYYIDTKGTSLASWPLNDGRLLIRIPTYCGLSARYYYCDGKELMPITIPD